MSIIELDDVVKRYESGAETVEALKGVDFHADRGEMVTIVVTRVRKQLTPGVAARRRRVLSATT
jgi:predicted ABC-type transport system involved in lysophospholipase L1 biosynthesis ATPase subunit